LGNDKANSIWEETLNQQQDKEKLKEHADRETRVKWIKSKYLTKDFMKFHDKSQNSEAKNRELYEAAKEGKLLAAATALAQGADVEWKNAEDGGKTPLHACAVSQRPSDGEWLAIECAELLIQNGADMKVLDHSSHNVLDCAVIGNADREMVEYLSTKFE
jgi:ankyrin repeat protein